jgi:phage terminase large subunit GpA-like protein
MRKCPSIHEFTAPPAELSLWRWAEASIVLTDRQSTAFPGPYRTRITPYVRGIMDALSDPAVREVWVMKSAQIGYTEILGNVAAYFISQDPSPMLMIACV